MLKDPRIVVDLKSDRQEAVDRLAFLRSGFTVRDSATGVDETPEMEAALEATIAELDALIAANA